MFEGIIAGFSTIMCLAFGANAVFFLYIRADYEYFWRGFALICVLAGGVVALMFCASMLFPEPARSSLNAVRPTAGDTEARDG